MTNDQPRGIKSQLRQWLERRRTPRIALNTEITLQSEDNLYTGISQDLSTGGVFVSTDRLLPSGSQGWVSFKIPTYEKDLKVQVIVRWVREPNPNSDTPAGMGLQFMSLNPEDAKILESFLEFRQPMLYEEEDEADNV
jgi:uncharacterized protein (TIGR02266 family)